jgi:hypothetical protein
MAGKTVRDLEDLVAALTEENQRLMEELHEALRPRGEDDENTNRPKSPSSATDG